MKNKLLKKLRARGRNMITVYKITMRGPLVVGMSYSYNDPKYTGLFDLGDTEEDVRNKAARIYMEQEIKRLRQKKGRKK